MGTEKATGDWGVVGGQERSVGGKRWGISQPEVHDGHATHPRDRSLPERALKLNALSTWH